MTRGTDVTDMKRTYRTVNEGVFPENLTLALEREAPLRYGENPNQSGAIYHFKLPEGSINLAELTNIRMAKSGKGGLSATNFMDVTRALEILKFFPNQAVAVMKHLVPSGFSTAEKKSLDQVYRNARDADARSAFGSVVVFNRPVDMVTAGEIMETYVEGVAAPEFEQGAMGVLERKKDLRAILYSNLDRIPKFIGDDTHGVYDIKALPTGRILVQQPYLSSIRSVEDLVLDPLVTTPEGRTSVVERDPTAKELEDLLTAWYVNLGVRSNGIVIVKKGTTIAIGSGQQERVGAVEQALTKACQKTLDRRGVKYDAMEASVTGLLKMMKGEDPLFDAVISSDGFFPFRDSVDLIASFDISAIIQPGGSVKDAEVIEAVNEHDMAMALTRERCFGHF